MIRPNDPCTCGSGKKFMVCCSGKRPREVGIRFTVDKPTKIDGIIIGPNGLLHPALQGQPIDLATAAAELTYDRRKGKKVLFSAPVDPQKPSLDLNAALLSGQVIIGVDTNTRLTGQTRVSLTCVVECVVQKNASGYLAEGIPHIAFETHNVIGDPERLGWRLAVEAVRADPHYKPATQVVVVVDSSLSALHQLNSKQLPVLEDWYLPDGFMLIYASADSATASVASQLISTCDKEATALLRRIASEGVDQARLVAAPAGAGYSHYREWNRK